MQTLNSKVIQISQSSAASSTSPYPVHLITALCEDGSMWVYRHIDNKVLNQSSWQRLPQLPTKSDPL
jgi:hypothetical protein